MVNGDSIDISTVKHKIPKVAFELFRFWTKEASINHQITIKTEQQLIQDLENTLKHAVKALYKKENLSQKPLGWDIGFVIGFLDGNLGKHWHHEYVAKTSEAYKSFAGLRAIENYLQYDELVKIKINKLYEHHVEENSNIDNLQLPVRKKDFKLENLELQSTSEMGKIEAILQNLIMQQIKIVIEMKNTIELPIQKYFSNEEIRQLIDNNR